MDQRRRVYDPRFGRFVQTDPLGYPDGLNPYAAYHVMWGGVDPWGLRTIGIEVFVPRNWPVNEKLVQDMVDKCLDDHCVNRQEHDIVVNIVKYRRLADMKKELAGVKDFLGDNGYDYGLGPRNVKNTLAKLDAYVDSMVKDSGVSQELAEQTKRDIRKMFKDTYNGKMPDTIHTVLGFSNPNLPYPAHNGSDLLKVKLGLLDPGRPTFEVNEIMTGNFKDAGGYTDEQAYSGTVLHEGIFHGIKGAGHLSSKGYADSETADYDEPLSPEGCKEMLRSLGFTVK